MIETVLIGNDAHMPEAVHKDERAELVALIAGYREAGGPEGPGAGSFEIYPGVTENAPDKTGAIVTVRPRRAVKIWNTEP